MRQRPPWLNAGAANQRWGSWKWWDEQANESTSGCGESDWQRSRVKLISCTAPLLLPPSQTLHMQKRITGFKFSRHAASRSDRLFWEEIKSSGVSAIVICETGRISGTLRRRQRVRETPRKEQNKQDVSSFRFTVVVGEIWLCSYSTLRTGQEEEWDRFTWWEQVWTGAELCWISEELLRDDWRSRGRSAEGCVVKDPTRI